MNGKVNIGNTNGKVILQTFTFDALRQYSKEIFKGQVPMCYLLWEGTYATDLTYTTPTGYADIIKFALDNGCHIIGPAISGAPNNYPEMNKPWRTHDPQERNAQPSLFVRLLRTDGQIHGYLQLWHRDQV